MTKPQLPGGRRGAEWRSRWSTRLLRRRSRGGRGGSFARIWPSLLLFVLLWFLSVALLLVLGKETREPRYDSYVVGDGTRFKGGKMALLFTRTAV